MRRLSFFFILLSLFFSSCSPTESPNLTIATAASASYAMEELSQVFSKETNIPCDVIIGSSGKLAAQIKAGAPYDVFVSADLKYPKSLEQANLAVSPPKIYGYGQLVLWSYNTTVQPYLDSLTKEEVKKIALANPKTAPYGKASMEALENQGLKDKLESKFVFGESISQTNQFITSQSADIGFTAKSVVLSPTIKAKGNWTLINPSTYTPIAQSVIIVNRNQEENRRSQAQAFYDYLFSAKGQSILRKYGYTSK